jgi:enoyl-CoA hydratase/carnithine racemase
VDFQEILYAKREGVATITLNRPHVLNAFSPTMLTEWVAALEDAKYDDDVRAVVVTGAGRGYCSGADVKLMAAGRPIVSGGRYQARLTVQRLPRAVESLDKPYIAAVNGAAVGGGFDTASMADIRIASDAATFAINHLRIAGLSADGGYYFLTRILGLSRTLELVLSCRFFDAQEALKMGYVSQVVPAAELQQAAFDLASRIAKGPPITTQLAKRLIYRCQDLGLDEHLEDVEAAVQINNHTEDSKEGPRAWAEKRAPDFKGR